MSNRQCAKDEQLAMRNVAQMAHRTLHIYCTLRYCAWHMERYGA